MLSVHPLDTREALTARTIYMWHSQPVFLCHNNFSVPVSTRKQAASKFAATTSKGTYPRLALTVIVIWGNGQKRTLQGHLWNVGLEVSTSWFMYEYYTNRISRETSKRTLHLINLRTSCRSRADRVLCNRHLL